MLKTIFFHLNKGGHILDFQVHLAHPHPGEPVLAELWRRTADGCLTSPSPPVLGTKGFLSSRG